MQISQTDHLLPYNKTCIYSAIEAINGVS